MSKVVQLEMIAWLNLIFAMQAFHQKWLWVAIPMFILAAANFLVIAINVIMGDKQ